TRGDTLHRLPRLDTLPTLAQASIHLPLMSPLMLYVIAFVGIQHLSFATRLPRQLNQFHKENPMHLPDRRRVFVALFVLTALLVSGYVMLIAARPALAN